MIPLRFWQKVVPRERDATTGTTRSTREHEQSGTFVFDRSGRSQQMPLTRGHTKRARGEPAEPPKQRVQKVCDEGVWPSTERWAEPTVEVAATAAAAAAAEAVTEAAVVMAGVEAQAGGIKATIAQLQANVSTLKAVNPQLMDKDDLDAVYMAVVELQQVSDAVQAQQEALRNPPPEETPLLFDDLVRVRVTV